MTLANQLPSVVSIFTLPILSEFITKQDYGIWGVILAYLGGFSILKDFGLLTVYNNTYFKYLTNGKYRFFWTRLYGFQIIWAFFYAIILGAILFLVTRKYVPQNTALIVLSVMIPSAFFESTKAISARLLQYNHKIPIIFVNSLITTLVAAGINIYTIKYLHWGYKGWALSYFTTNLIGFFYYGRQLWFNYNIRPSFQFSWKWVKKQLKISVPSIPIYYTTYILNTSDRLIMDFYKIPIAVLGGYNVAYGLGIMIDAGMYAFGQILSPIFYKLFGEKKAETPAQVRMLTFFWQAFAIIVSFLLSLWVKEIYSFVYRNNKELQELYVYAIPIFVSYSYRPMYSVLMYRTLYEHQAVLNSKVAFLAACTNLTLNFVFIPYFNINAAIATTFISLMVLSFAGYFWKTMGQYLELNYYPGVWLLSIVISGLIVFSLKDIHFSYKILVSLILVSGYMWVLKKNYTELELILKRM